MPHKGFQEENTRPAQKDDLRRGPVFPMNLLPFMILSLLIFTRAPEASARLLVTINDEKEEKEKEAASDTKHVIIQPTVHIYIKKDIPVHAEASGNKNNEALKLHNSLESLREYLEEIGMKKAEEQPSSRGELPEALRDEFGPHYHTMNTEEPPLELPLEELQVNEVFEDRPKDLFFRPVPLSDKADETQERVQKITNEDRHVRETVLLGVSSATLAVLLLLTVCCAVSIYHCSKQYTYWDNLSLTSSEQRALFGPSYYQSVSDSSVTQGEGALWAEPASAPETSSQMKLTRTLTFSATIHAVDEVSSFSDESTRTTEKVRSTEQSETEQSDVGALGAPKHLAVRPVSAPQPALAPPPSIPQGALAPPSAPGAAPPAAPSRSAPAPAPPAPPTPSTPGTAPPAPPSSTPGTAPPAPASTTPGTAPPAPPPTTPGTAPSAPQLSTPGTAPPAQPSSTPETAPPPTTPGTAPAAPPPTTPGTAPQAPPPTTPETAPPAPSPTTPGTAPQAPPPTTPGTAPAPPPSAPTSSTPAPPAPAEAPPPPVSAPPPVGVPTPSEPNKPPPS